MSPSLEKKKALGVRNENDFDQAAKGLLIAEPTMINNVLVQSGIIGEIENG